MPHSRLYALPEQALRRPWRARLGAALLLLLLLAGWAEAAHAAPAQWPNDVKIFNTMDFKSPIKNMPQWERVMSRGDKEMNFFSTCQSGTSGCPAAAGRWQKLLAELKGQPPMKQLQEVNKFYNTWPYRTDMDAYGVLDYWASPMEFVTKSGDCEDYAIIKFYALKRLGWDPNNLRIAAVTDRILNLGHAILVAYLEGEVYVLDNQSTGVFGHSRFKHYEPHYSVNEFYKWAHVPARR